MKTAKIRLFRPGDRVQHKWGGPVMIVQRYARKHSMLLGWYESNYSVECSWLGSDGYNKETINQNNLRKIPPSHRENSLNAKPNNRYSMSGYTN